MELKYVLINTGPYRGKKNVKRPTQTLIKIFFNFYMQKGSKSHNFQTYVGSSKQFSMGNYIVVSCI